MSSLDTTPLWKIMTDAASNINGSAPIALDYRRLVHAGSAPHEKQGESADSAELAFAETLIRIVWNNRSEQQFLLPHLLLFSLFSKAIFTSERVTIAEPGPGLRASRAAGGMPIDDVGTLRPLITKPLLRPDQIRRLTRTQSLLVPQGHWFLEARRAAVHLYGLAQLLGEAGFALTPDAQAAVAQGAVLRGKVVIVEFEGFQPQPESLPREQIKGLRNVLRRIRAEQGRSGPGQS